MRLILLLTALLAFQSAAASEFDEMKALADQGYADAQFYLGNVYLNGEGLQENVVEAVKWYRKAADQGYVKAQFNLAQAYFIGKGVPKNGAEAVKWYGKAAEQGDSQAHYELGVLYGVGKGTKKDYSNAYLWWLISARLGGEADLEFAAGLLEEKEIMKTKLLAVKCYESNYQECD